MIWYNAHNLKKSSIEGIQQRDLQGKVAERDSYRHAVLVGWRQNLPAACMLIVEQWEITDLHLAT